MIYLLRMVIFQLAMLVYQRVYPIKLPCFQGLILRDYLVLCHGFQSARNARVIAAAVSWNPGTMAPSRAGRGKPSGSRLQCLGMGCLVRNQRGMFLEKIIYKFPVMIDVYWV